jgi:hypothetical protein
MEKQLTKKMVMLLDCGVGMNSADFFNVPVTMTEKELNDYAWDCALEFAQGYGVEPAYCQPTYASEEEAEQDTTDYSDDISGWFEDYDPEKHEGLRVGNSDSWQDM